jgi:hypothetical protein
LAGYIFGQNDTGKKIAMTAPVHMDIKEKASSMSFVMPGSYNKYNLPKPIDPAIIIKESPEEYVAVLSFGGFASDKDIQANADKLENILKKNGINYFGNFRFLGYNPPYQLFGRKNEIIVSINWRVE